MRAESLFLTPFEELMHELHSAARPMVFMVRLHFEGRFEMEACRKAVFATFSHHPLTRSRVAGRSPGLFWEVVRDPTVSVEEGDPPPIAFSSPSLEDGPGVVVRVTIGSQRSLLDIELHHAVSDGRGALALLRDFLTEYARALGAEVPPVDRDQEMLRSRGHFGLSLPSLLSEAPRQLLGLIGIRRAVMRHPVRVRGAIDPAKAPVPDAPEREVPRVFFHRFDPDTTGLIARAARAKGATTNHVLVTTIYEAIVAWRERQGESADGSWIRVATPFDLRTLEQLERLPAANVMSLVFLDRRARAVRQPDRLLISLRNEMGFIRAWRLALTFVLALAALKPFSGLRRRLMKLRATAFATNLGRIVPTGPMGKVTAGGVTLDRVDAFVPLLPDTPLSFGFYQYAGELNLTLRYDPEVFTASDAREFFDSYLARVSDAARREP
ncbi:MAG: hypothetical protein K1Y01_19315 [Vicinamibacteria bacterium]|nr:hypothetical protein [Vicinamibacteria bacterium]